MSITGISGDIGSGKSFKMLHYALELCNARKKGLVLNFPLNYPALLEYAHLMKYDWLTWLIKAKRIKHVSFGKSNSEALEKFLSYHNSICVLDEAGIFLGARDWQSTPKQLLADLCQSRKLGIDLIWASQFSDQVDKNFRLLTQFWIHADGLRRYSHVTKKPELLYKVYYHFTAEKYARWATDSKAKTNGIRTRFLHAYRTDAGRINSIDKVLFSCFDSYARLDNEKLIDKRTGKLLPTRSLPGTMTPKQLSNFAMKSDVFFNMSH